MSTATRRRKPGTKRERTRAALIAATLAVVAEKGFAAASLDDIAAKAQMTKGAIYSNFSGKAELLLAAMGAKGLILEPAHRPNASLGEHLQATGKALADLIRRAEGEAKFLAEFQLYALGDPELRRAISAIYSRAFSESAGWLRREFGRPNPHMSPKHLAVALQSIALGFVFQSFITPGDVSDGVIRETMKALADGLSRGK